MIMELKFYLILQKFYKLLFFDNYGVKILLDVVKILQIVLFFLYPLFLKLGRFGLFRSIVLSRLPQLPILLLKRVFLVGIISKFWLLADIFPHPNVSHKGLGG